ncbi:Uncharacterised protein [Mycobacterium tuberculosis]|nr:Uncharacterised protein [Mycobacterium tuberculosis]CKT85416.1 Uncharacterised protein [Mycobacterium tuberculosis]CKV98567.1 Uncharacterised protein [Mycobacterium tuberculosis]CNM57187.1 Uncharacterised protein [Mycobacterium tuberculosis]CNM79139.1 Uncharacterised protein [Mycobacterium tuberculosis]
MMVATGLSCGEHVGQPHHFPVGVGYLDADGGLAGDRCQHAHALGSHRVGDVALQRGDLLDLDAGPQFDLVAGDGGPAGAARDGRVDLELGQHLTDGAGHVGVGRTAFLGRITGYQQVQRRQRVGTLDDPVQHLGIFAAAASSGAPTGGGFRYRRSVILRNLGRRPGRWPVVGAQGHLVVVTVGEVLAGDFDGVRVVTIEVREVLEVVGVFPWQQPGAEHGAHGIWHLSDRDPGQQEQSEQRADE